MSYRVRLRDVTILDVTSALPIEHFIASIYFFPGVFFFFLRIRLFFSFLLSKAVCHLSYHYRRLGRLSNIPDDNSCLEDAAIIECRLLPSAFSFTLPSRFERAERCSWRLIPRHCGDSVSLTDDIIIGINKSRVRKGFFYNAIFRH